MFVNIRCRIHSLYIQRLVSNLCCKSWTKFSAQTSCGEQDSGCTAEIPDRLHVHSNSGRKQKTQPCITFVETYSGVVISFMCARDGGYEDLTKEILRPLEAYGFLNPVIIQCDKEVSIIDVCRKVGRERNARTVLRFAPITSHQSNGFVQAVHGHIQGLARCYQTQIETTTGLTTFSHFTSHSIYNSLRWIFSLKIHNATRRQNPIPIFALNSHMYHFCACLVNRYSL